ncbi:MAG: hypothetical protein ACRDQ7_22500 [Haloechinothrix sp.]
MGDGDGFGYDTGALEQVVQQFRSATQHLDSANAAAVDMVDAGASSEVVGSALAGLLTSSVETAEVTDTIADRVNTAKGSYHNIENTNEGAILKRQLNRSEADHGMTSRFYGG